MTMTDPLADMFTRIRNATASRHDSVRVPESKVKQAIAEVLQQEGFIRGFAPVVEGPRRYLNLQIMYDAERKAVLSGIRRVSRPGLRVYVGKREIPRVYGGLGVAIMSTSQGVMSGREAWRRKLGGEVLCYVW
ncbi:MAG: 30S ribosomal protein S8 [Dehalococcoidia bacterium]|nr:30S ribosomal protein S8 [Dehalococcoidia bacterium]